MAEKLALGLACLVLSGCGDIDYNPQTGPNAHYSPMRVTLYAKDGTVIREWRTRGPVLKQPYADGWIFTDQADFTQVRVTGNVVVEPWMKKAKRL